MQIAWESPCEPGLVSIVTVVRNDREGLARTLDSVAKQTFGRFEHVVIDGASIDGSVELLRGVRSVELRWFSEPDGGISHAFNKGLARTRGEWVQFLNAGDMYLSERSLESMVAALDDTPILSGFAKMEDKRIPARVLTAADPLRRRALLSHQSTLTHRRVFEDLGGFDPSLRVRMDYEFWLRTLQKYPVRFVDDTFTEFALGGNSYDLTAFHREERVANSRHLARPMPANLWTLVRFNWRRLQRGLQSVQR